MNDDDVSRPRHGRTGHPGGGVNGRRPGDAVPGSVSLFVDGQRVDVRVGHTVASALLAGGRRSWRHTRTGAPRGLFCGIGVCFDCLVTVNGLPDVRACQRLVSDGDDIRTQQGPRLPHDAQPLPVRATTTGEASDDTATDGVTPDRPADGVGPTGALT